MNMHELKKVSRFIYNCRKCGLCGNKVTEQVPYVCPVREVTPGFDHFYSRGKLIIARGLLEGTFTPVPELVSAAYSCTLCANCMTQCGASDPGTGTPLVETEKVVQSMRADLLRDHPEWVDGAYHAALKSTRQYENPWGMPRSAREKWSRGLGLKNVRKEEAGVLLFVGCTAPLQPVLAERARKAVLLMQKAGVTVGTLGKDETCCGSVQRKIGDVELADDLREKNISLMNSTGCPAIVTLCAGCYNTLKNDYNGGAVPLAPKVYHIVEFLAKLMKEKKLALTREQNCRVAYHDPCHLGRHAGIFNPPRDILHALPGIELVERRATRENTICCGAGGGMRMFDGGTLASKMGAAAVAEAKRAGAVAIVTACPFCEMNLDAASKTLDVPLPVYDIVDLVFEASGAGSET